MESFVSDLESKTDEIADLLMWEIARTRKDATSEVTRTIAFIRTAIAEARKLSEAESKWESEKGITAQIRHLPLGVVLTSSPFN